MIDPRRPDYASNPHSRERVGFAYARAVCEGEKPAVSIVTPFHNTLGVFHETAAAVKRQSLQRYEWIIVNDGSKLPASLGMLERYRRGGDLYDDRIRVIDHRANHGLPAARNTGFRVARAPYVFMLDSDDLIEPTTLEKCALYLDNNPGAAFVKGFSVGFGALEYLWDKGFHEGEAFLWENRCTATAMVRRDVHEEVGGFDETIRGGLEDWEFWLRCASHGRWGGTIPEYLDWYRRRNPSANPWANLGNRAAGKRMLSRLRSERPGLFEPGGFARCEQPPVVPYAPIRERAGFDNPLAKGCSRLLMIVPWLRMGGADRYNLDLVDMLTRHVEPRWEVTIAATSDGHPWLAEFTRHTPDVFLLGHLGPRTTFPAMIRHLIESRRPDVVMVSNSEPGYIMLPWLRAVCPEPAYVDFNHMEEMDWKNGGHARTGAAMSGQLDLSIVVSEHLKNWMSEPAQGAERERIEVCYINANTEAWRPDAQRRAEVRAELGIGEDVPVILYAARLCPQKQPLVFARTMELLKEAMGGFVALVAGDGEDQGALERYLDDRRLRGCVRMLGPVEAKRMLSVMAAADIFFLPSRWEGIALSIYEAMSCGVAVVGADVGGQKELVTPETGILLPRPVDEEGRADLEAEAGAYARVLAELIADGGAARRAAMGAAARERIKAHFELEMMGKRMLALFEAAARLRKDSPRAAVPVGLAREMVVQGLESLRVQDESMVMAPHYERAMEAQARAEAAARAAQEALRRIEESRTWRAVQRMKKLPPYRALARVRFGPNWDMVDVKEPAHARLARVRNSRSYRFIEAMKRLPVYPVYARMRYGEPRS